MFTSVNQHTGSQSALLGSGGNYWNPFKGMVLRIRDTARRLRKVTPRPPCRTPRPSWRSTPTCFLGRLRGIIISLLGSGPWPTFFTWVT